MTQPLVELSLLLMAALCCPIHVAGDELRRCPNWTRLHRALPRTALLAQASDAMLATPAVQACDFTANYYKFG